MSLQLFLAPIQGMTNDLYRKLYHQHFNGIDVYYAPFAKMPKFINPNRKQKTERFPAYAPNMPLVPQLLSNDADEFLVFDQVLGPWGYPEFNWNLGCPVAMVTHKKRGSGLLPHADRIQSILEQIMPQLKCRLSIKVRLGLNNPQELMTAIAIFNQFPIKALIIHPRLGSQLYKGQVDLAALSECLRISRHPVVYNGDIFNAQTFFALQKQFPGISQWMLGRGILANPFLPAQIKGVAESAADKLKRIRQFHDDYFNQYALILSGPSHLLDKLKEFWSYLHLLFEGGNPFFRRLLKINKIEVYQELVEQFFALPPRVLEHLAVVSEDFV